MKDVFDVRRSNDSNDVLKKLNGQFMNVKTISADYQLLDTDCGYIFVDGSVAVDVTLPPAAAGLWYKIILTDTTAIIDLVEGTDSGNIIGNTSEVSAKDSAVSGDTKLICSTGCLPGDYITAVCDGTNWYVEGVTAVDNQMNFG